MRKPAGTSVSIEPKVFMIDRARESQAEKFRKHTEFTHHLWVDDDMCIVDPDALMKLLARDKPIVSALYCRADWPHYPILLKEYGVDKNILFEYEYADKPYPKNQLVPVDAIGFGFVLIKREVYEKIQPPYFKWVDEGNTQYGEDVYFSNKARAAGFKVYVDTGVELLHVVRTPIGPDHVKWAWFRRRYPLDSRKLAMINKAMASLSNQNQPPSVR